MPEHFLKSIVDHKDTPTVAAALASVALRFLIKRGTTPREALVAVVAAVSLAYWGSPVIAETFDLGPRALPLIGLVCGMVAADLARGLLRLAAHWARRPEDFLNHPKDD